MTAPRLQAVDALGEMLADPTHDQVHDMFANLNAHCLFAIVERLDREPTGEHYFQIHLDYVGDTDTLCDVEPEVEYDAEFRAGGRLEQLRGSTDPARSLAPEGPSHEEDHRTQIGRGDKLRTRPWSPN